MIAAITIPLGVFIVVIAGVGFLCFVAGVLFKEWRDGPP